MKKTLAIVACITLASCAQSIQKPTAVELIGKHYSADAYMVKPHPISDSALAARWDAFAR